MVHTVRSVEFILFYFMKSRFYVDIDIVFFFFWHLTNVNARIMFFFFPLCDKYGNI